METPSPWGPGADQFDDRDNGTPISKPIPPAKQVQPVERHDPLADDKLFLRPSPRRPRQRDLERLAARWSGWR